MLRSPDNQLDLSRNENFVKDIAEKGKESHQSTDFRHPIWIYSGQWNQKFCFCFEKLNGKIGINATRPFLVLY